MRRAKFRIAGFGKDTALSYHRFERTALANARKGDTVQRRQDNGTYKYLTTASSNGKRVPKRKRR